MRQALVALVFAIWIAPAGAASLDPDRIAAIDRAADAFLAKAAEAHKTGQVPRQSDPGIGPLLDTVLNTDDLRHGPVDYGDLGKLSDWLKRIVAVGRVYLAAGRTVHDIGLFGPEIGRFFDAAVNVTQAIADSVMAELDAHPDAKLAPDDQRSLSQLRAGIGGTLVEMIDLLRSPGVSVGWALQRVAGLRAAAPSMARFLTPEETSRLRAAIVRLAGQLREKTLRGALDAVAVALSAPAPPVSPPAEAASAGGEIALERDGQNYYVPVRVNGATTVKFVVDSGAGIVMLPSDLVDTLTKSGAIASTDQLGRSYFIAADGRRHKAARLMLRQLDVGGHTVTNLMALVGPAHAEPLLGQTFLAKFKSWTLDNRRHVLIIAE
jgi:clan AA aspartic protease (TIGR02281 family)